MKPKLLLAPFIIALTSVTGVLHAQTDADSEPNDAAPTEEITAKETRNIVEIAAATEEFSTLAAALKASGLDASLQGEGPFTVFAPTNEAFAKLPEGMVAKLMEPENRERLVSILSYHVVPKTIMSADIVSMNIATAGGKEATVTLDSGTVMINAAEVTKADIAASNGVIHVIDKVLIPSVGKEAEEATSAEPAE